MPTDNTKAFAAENGIGLNRPNEAPSALDIALAGRQEHVARVQANRASAIDRLQRQGIQNTRQRENPLGSLYTDSDIARAYFGSVSKGIGSAIEGTGYALGGLDGKDDPGYNPLERLGRTFKGYGERTLGDYDVSTQDAIRNSTPTGSITDPSSWRFGDDASLKGYGFQMLQIFGEFAPQAAALVARGAPGLVISGAVGASQAGISQGDESEKYIMNMPEEELIANSTLYKELLTENLSPEEARVQTAKAAKVAAFTTGAIIGGAGGSATQYILKSVGKQVTGSAVKRIAKTAGISAVEEGTQEALETIGSREAANVATGTDRDITENTFGDALLGGLFGGQLGGAGAVAQIVSEKLEEKGQANDEQKKRTLEVSEAVISGDFDSIADPSNRDKYPADVSVAALGTVLNDDEANAETKNKALVALETIEQETKNKLERAKAIQEDPEKYYNDIIEKQENDIADMEALKSEFPEESETIDESIEESKRYIEVNQEKLANFDSNENKKLIKKLEEDNKVIFKVKGKDLESSNEVETINSEDTTEDLINTPTDESVIEVASRALVNPSSVTDDDLDKLATNGQGVLDQDTLDFIAIAAKARSSEQALLDKTKDSVRNNIFSDNPASGHISIKSHKKLISGALKANDIERATNNLANFESFARGHYEKARAMTKALREVGDSRKTFKILPNEGDNGWTYSPSTFAETPKVNKAGGLTISRKSNNLVSYIQEEATVLRNTYKAMEALVNKSVGTNTDTGTEAPVDVTEGQEANTPSDTPNTQDSGSQELRERLDALMQRGLESVDRTKSSKTLYVGPLIDTTDHESVKRRGEIESFRVETNNVNTDPEEPANTEPVVNEPPTSEPENNDRATEQSETVESSPVKNTNKNTVSRAKLVYLNRLINKPEGAEINSVINWAIRNGDPALADLLKGYKKLSIVKTLGNVTKTGGIENTDNDAGYYVKLSHKIAIDPSKVKDGSQESVEYMAEVIVHEVTHAVTYVHIANNDYFKSEIKEINDEIREWINDPKNAEALIDMDLDLLTYATSDPQELLSTVFGSKKLREDLNKIVSKQQDISAIKKIFKAIIDAVAKLTSIPSEQLTLLDRVIALGEEVISLEADNQRAGSTQTISPEVTEAPVDVQEEVQAEVQEEIEPEVEAEAEVIPEEVNEVPIFDNFDFSNDYEAGFDEESFNTFITDEELNSLPNFDNAPIYEGEELLSREEFEIKQIEDAAKEKERRESEFNNINERLLDFPVKKNIDNRYAFQQNTEYREIEGFMNEDELFNANKLTSFFDNTGKTNLSRFDNFFLNVVSKAAFAPEVLHRYVKGGKKTVDKFLLNTDPYIYFNKLFSEKNRTGRRVNAIHKSSSKKYRWTTPLDYFIDPISGNLDSTVVEAIAVGNFNFITTTGNSLWWNTTDSAIKRALGLDPNTRMDDIPEESIKAVREVGSRQTSISRQLGRDILKILSLKLKSNVPENELSQIEGALGNMAVALLLDAKYLQRVEVSTDVIGNVDTRQRNFFLRSNKIFDTLDKKWIPNPVLSEFSDLGKGSGTILSDVFGSASRTNLPTLEPKEYTQEFTSGEIKVPENQKEYIKQMNAKEYKLNTRLVNPNGEQKGLLDRLGKDTLKRIAGFVDTESTPTNKNLIPKVEAKNAAIEKEIDDLYDVHISKVLQGDANKGFFLDHNVKLQQRVHNVSDGFNPQANKLHRFISSVGDWSYEVNPTKGTSKATKVFKLSVLEALGVSIDGGRVNNVLKEFNNIIKDPEILAAVKVITDMNNDLEYVPEGEALESLMKVVNSEKVGIHAFIGLHALSDYMEARKNKTTFRSSLMMEGDGKTNGPMFILMQLGLSGTDDDIALMQLGGFFTEDSSYNNYGEFSEDNKMDLYKLMAVDAISYVRTFLRDRASRNQGNLVTKVVGELTETINSKDSVGADAEEIKATSAARQLTKGMITEVVYGSAVSKTLEGLGNSFLDSVYEKLGKLHGKADEANSLIDAINNNLNKKNQIKKNSEGDYLNLTFNSYQEALIKGAIVDTFGAGVEYAIKERFETLIKTRNALNQINAMSARMYINVYETRKSEILNEKLKKSREAKGEIPLKYRWGESKENKGIRYLYSLTAEEEASLKEELSSIFPVIHTPLSKKANDINAGLSLLRSAPEVTEISGGVQGLTKFNEVEYQEGEQTSKFKQLRFRGALRKLAGPGVGGIVTSIQSLDAGVAIPNAAKHNVLNVHDAAIGSALDMADVMQDYNKNTFDLLANFSQAEEMIKTYLRISKEYKKYQEQYKDNAKFNYRDDRLNSVKKDKKGNDLINKEQVPAQALGVALFLSSTVHKNKLKLLSKMSVVDQYYADGGKYKVKVREQNKVEKRYREESFYDLVGLKPPKNDVLPAPRQSNFNPSNSNKVIQYTTKEVFDSLNSTRTLSRERSNKLKNTLDSIVNHLYGPLGVDAEIIKTELGETPIELISKLQQNGKYRFTSSIAGSGIKLSSAEAFVAEQIELTVQEALKAGTNTDKEILKIFRDVKARSNSDGRDFYQGDWNSATDSEKQEAKKIYEFIFNINTNTGDSRSSHISRFIALSNTYEPLTKLLDYSTVTVNTVDLTGKPSEIISNGFNKLLQAISNSNNNIYSGQNTNERLNSLLGKLVINEHKRKLAIVNSPNNVANQIDGAIETVNRKIAEGVTTVTNTDLIRNNKYGLVQGAGAIARTVANDQVGELYGYLTKFRNDKLRNRPMGLAMSTFNEIRGAVDQTQGIHKMLAVSNQLQQERKALKDNISKEVIEAFLNSENITTEEKAAITQIYLRGDLSKLLDDYSHNEIAEFVLNKNKRDVEIRKLKKELRGISSNANPLLKSSYDLAYFMATGRTSTINTLKNAHNISRQLGTDNIISSEDARSTEPTIDKLVSLLALNYTDNNHFDNIKSLLETETAREGESGLKALMNTQNILKKDASEHLFDNNPVLQVKGYTRELYDPYTTIKAANREEGNKLLELGYVFVGPLAKSRLMTKDSEKKGLYKLSGVGLQNRETGILSFTNEATKGSTLSVSTNANNKRTELERSKETVRRVLREERPYSESYDPSKVTADNAIPVFNQYGEIANFQVVMNHSTKDKVMNRDNDFESIIGSIASNQFDKVSSKAHNDNVIESLHEFYKEDYSKNKGAYIELSIDSPVEHMRESYKLLPDSAKRKIRETWGGNKMYIRNDVLDITTGYKNFSLTDSFGKDAVHRNVAEQALVAVTETLLGKSAATKVRKAEDAWIEAVKLLKSIIVIRNGFTFSGNVVSNTSTLLWHGVPIKTIGKLHREAIVGLDNYQRDHNTLTRKRSRIGNGTPEQEDKLAQEIKELEFNIERNPVTILVKEGLFQSIQEDIDSVDSSSKFNNPFDTFVEKQASRLHPTLRKIGEYAVVSENTPMYKLLNKGTQMSDFVGRYVLYQHFINRPNNPLSHKKAIEQLREVFVNYDVLSHKYLQYSNLVGLTMFTKYYLRTQKVIYNLMRSNGGRGLGLAITDNYISGLSTIMDSSVLSKGLGNPLDAGAFGLVDAVDEPLPLHFLFDLFK